MCQILKEGTNNSPTSPHTFDRPNNNNITNNKMIKNNTISSTKVYNGNMNNPKNNNSFVDLTSTEYHINDLKYCSNVKSLVDDFLLNKEQNINSNTTSEQSNVLIFDLSPNESSIPSLFTVSSPASSLFTLLSDTNKSSLSLSQQKFFKFHLNLPSTLLKRKNFKFENLLQITFTDDKRKRLLQLIDNCITFVLYDKFSTLNHCSIQTYSLIIKFIKFLQSINKFEESQLILLSNNEETNNIESKISNNRNFMNNILEKKKMKNRPALQNFNLTIKIPKNSTTGMFVHSIKKDSIQYSPLSLKKYFTFNIPDEISLNDSILPIWMQPFTDKTQKDEILVKLLKKFDMLEDMEVQRLSDCIDDENMNQNRQYEIENNTITRTTNPQPIEIEKSNTNDSTITKDLQSSNSYHKIYSLTHLQQQFKKQKKDTSKRNSINKIKRVSSLHRKSSLKRDGSVSSLSSASSSPSCLLMNNALESKPISKAKTLQLPPLIITEDNQNPHANPSSASSTSNSFALQKLKNISNTNDHNNNNNNVNSDFSENNLNSSTSDTLVTPLVHYQVSQGIQSFNKNRYSNILPYEHSRVKLQYSPLINTNADFNTAIAKHINNNNNNNTPNNDDNNNIHLTASNATTTGTNDDKILSPANNTLKSSISRTNSESKRQRKNSSSYFSLNFIPQHFNQQLTAPKNIVSPTSSVSSNNFSPLVNSNSDDDNNNTAHPSLANTLGHREGSSSSSPSPSSSTSIVGFSNISVKSDNINEDSTNVDDSDINSSKRFNDYFNANYLSLPQINSDYEYIATQAPLPSTIDDFWKVIMSNKVKVIVSLNSDDELQHKKWDIYWGNEYNNTTRRFKISIVKAIENVYNLDGCTLRVFQVVKNNAYPSDYCVVYQLQYSKWIDSCSADMSDLQKLFRIKNHLISSPVKFLSKLNISLDTISDLTTLQKNCKNYRRESTSKSIHSNVPLLVHCSAGCGRTGVFITLDFLVNILTPGKDKHNKIDVWNMNQDLIFIIINELRKQRISMVQNLTQYISCYESMLKYFSIQKNKAEITDQFQ